MSKFQKLSVIYHAPEGDNKVVEMMNTTFYDGKETEMIASPEQFETLQSNPHFEVVSHADHDPHDDKPTAKATAKVK